MNKSIRTGAKEMKVEDDWGQPTNKRSSKVKYRLGGVDGGEGQAYRKRAARGKMI